jgi:hypothetical protein
VESRHNGNTHTNSLSLAKLLALIKGSSQISDEVLMSRLINSLGLTGTVSGELLTDRIVLLQIMILLGITSRLNIMYPQQMFKHLLRSITENFPHN